jgi:quinoprotein glucose dehydrogenase
MRTFVLGLLLSCLAAHAAAADNVWSFYGGDAGGTRYSTLKQITPANVARLKAVWTYHTGALSPETDLNHKAAFEATPILIDGTLYLTTPFNAVIALDPATGAERWKFDPKVDRSHDYSEVTSRGVACGSSKEPSTRASSPLMAKPASRAPASARMARSISAAASATVRNFAAIMK